MFDVTISHLEEAFDLASNFVMSSVLSFSQDQLLLFYGYYKQATVGPCNIPKPGMFDFKGKRKWESWKNLGELEKAEAMQLYIAALTKIDPEWESKAAKEPTVGGWVTVSRPICDNNSDDTLTIYDFAKSNDVTSLSSFLNHKEINLKDENGLALLHWASDRGSLDIVQYLLENNADVDLQDYDGQTALHYASSCNHIEIVQLLLSYNADKSIKDYEGVLPIDCTDCEIVKKMLK